MKAILLAAGFATRLHPLTRDRAKPLLEVGGEPIATHLVRRIAAIPQVSGIVVVSNHRFHAQFVEWSAGLDLAVPLEVLDDGSTANESRLGAIADMALAMHHVGDGEDFAVVAGDNLVAFDLAPFARRMLATGRPVLAVRRAVGAVPPRRYGEVELDDGGHVRHFREKPEEPRTGWLSTSLYFYPARIRSRVDEYLATGANPDAPGYFLEWLVAHEEVEGVEIPGEWYDIGTLETLEEARRSFAG